MADDLLLRSQDWEKFKSLYEELFFGKVGSFFSGHYPDLCKVVFKYCKLRDDVLLTGHESADLGKKLYDRGIHKVVILESSQTVADQRSEKDKEKRPSLQYVATDCTKVHFSPESFNVVVDEGKLDNIFREANETHTASKEANQTLVEVQRIVKTGGRYLCITLAPEPLLNKLLDHFSNGWFVRIHKVDPEKMSEELVSLFVFVFTKTRFVTPSAGANPSVKVPKILELCLHGTDFINRLDNLESVKSVIQECQAYCVIRNKLRNTHFEDRLTLELWTASGTEKERESPRYSLSIIDIPLSESKNGKFAIFIVPQGREVEWMFSSRDGQRQLASAAGFARLVLVSLSRDHVCNSIDAVKQELSHKVMELAPQGVGKKTQVPFLSVGDDVGSRVALHQGSSEFSGNYVIEDVSVERGEQFRRLIFLNNKNTIQSEARLITDPHGTKRKQAKSKQQKKCATGNLQIDYSYLSCEHHKAIVAGLSLLEGLTRSDDSLSGLLVGLGGGGLPMFLHQYINQLSLDVVELDPSMFTIAKRWFGFVEHERMTVIIEDGLKFITEKASAIPTPCYHVIIFDVDSKDLSTGMSAPPRDFVDKTLLRCIQLLLHPTGVFILNFICRNTVLRSKVLLDIRSVFPRLCGVKIKDEVNEIIFAMSQEKGTDWQNTTVQDTFIASVRTTVAKLQQSVQQSNQEKPWDPNIDLCGLMDNLKVL